MKKKQTVIKDKAWVRHYRNDKGVWEDICPHGVGHEKEGVHGCDGCCADFYDYRQNYECTACGDKTPDEGICFMCKETKI